MANYNRIMKPNIAVRCLYVFVVSLILVSCSSNPYMATPTASIKWRYETVTSPTGRFQLQKKCPPNNINALCSWIFPNGTETPPFSQVSWSNDDQFAYICAIPGSSIQCVYGTPQIWDVANGSLIADRFALEGAGRGATILQWKADESILAYLDMVAAGPPVYVYDAKDRKLSKMTTCPRWLVDSLPKDDTPGMLEKPEDNWLVICSRLSYQATSGVP